MTERLDHLDPATIAALVDRTLDAEARRAAETHLAICAECREVWVETSEIADGYAAASAPGKVVSARPVKIRRWIYAGAGIAAAVALAAGAWMWRETQPTPERAIAGLISDVGDRRFTSGRLSAPFAWGEPPASVRSGTTVEPSLAVQRRAVELQQLAERRRTMETLRAAGLGLLALGRVDEAIVSLEAAAREDAAAVMPKIDLAAAFLEQWRLEGETTAAVKAMDQSRRALELDPANASAAFNHALALEALGLRAQAIGAWRRYLQLDGTSPWAAEARSHLAGLERARQSRSSLSGLYDELEDQRLRAWGAAVLSGNPAPSLQEAVRHVQHPSVDPSIKRTVMIAAEGTVQPARVCLARAAVSTADWRTAFEQGHSEAGLRAADAAVNTLRCAGLEPIDAYARRSVSLLELSRLDEADAQASRVIEGSKLTDFPRAHSRALQIRGLVAFQRGRFSDAVEFITSAIVAAEVAQDRELATALRTILATLYDQQGDERAAWVQLRFALQGVAETSSLRRRYAILSSAAGRAAALSLEGAALTLTDALIDETAGWSNAVGRAVGHLQRAEMYDRLERVERSADDIAAAERLVPAIESAAVRQDLAARTAFYRGLVTREPQAAIRTLTYAVDEFVRTENTIAAAPALLARGRAYKAASMIGAARADWLRGLELIEDQRRKIRTADLRVSRLDRVWDLYEELIALERDAPLESLAFAERGRARELYDTLNENSVVAPLTGLELVEALPRGTDAVVYASLKHELFVWHVRDGAVTLEVKPVGRERLASLVDGYRTAVRNSATAESPELSALLLPASLRLTEGATVLFSPDGPIHALPFAALRASARDRFLIEKTQPILIPSLSSFASRNARPRGRAPGVLLVGADEPGEKLPRLPFVAEEIDALARLYPSATRLEGKDVTSDAVRAALPGKNVIHFSGHAVVEPRFPARSRLVLGSASVALTAVDITRMPLERGATVVLGACDTAVGAVSRGEGAAALSRAFLLAGASSVVGTLWRVNDRDSAPLLVQFHRALLQGVSAESALARAQRDSIGRGVAPAAWAAFSLNQSGRQ